MAARKKKPTTATIESGPEVQVGSRDLDLDVLACCLEGRGGEGVSLERSFAAAQHWVGGDESRLRALQLSVKHRPGAISFSGLLERAETFCNLIEPRRGRKRSTNV